MEIKVYIEVAGDKIRQASLESLSAGIYLKKRCRGRVVAIVPGPVPEQVLEEITHFEIDEVLWIKNSELTPYLVEPHRDAVLSILGKEDCLILPATKRGNELAPRIAARFSVPMASNVFEFDVENGALVYLKRLYGGKVIGRFRLNAKPLIVTVVPRAFPVPEKAESSCPVVERSVEIPRNSLRVRHRGVEVTTSEGIDLYEADVIFAGGRGMAGPEGFKLLKELADIVNSRSEKKAAVGASRAAVDAGWIDHSHQIGQTGKVVSPEVYFAFGISGALQHIVGMRNSKFIVAVNRDPEAPIFKYADLGIVEDLFKMVPLLKEELGKVVK